MKVASKIIAALSVALLANTISYAQSTIKLANLLEMSGSGATVGMNMNDGVKLAVKEINASGGVLGRKFEVTTYDTQTNPGIAKGLAQKVVDDNVFAVIGPIFSGSILVSMSETRRAEIPNFTGAASALVTQQGHQYVIRTNSTQVGTMPKVVRYMKDTLKVKTVDMIWVNNDFGKGGRDEIIKALQANGIKVGADISTDQGQVDFSSAVLKAKQSNGDVLFAYVHEEESARLLKALRNQGYSKPIMGETTVVNQKTIELAGSAANGVIGHVPLTADAPHPAMKAFNQKFFQEYKYRPDHNGIQGYMIPYIIKAVSEKIGKVDSKEFNKSLRGMRLYVKDHPGILLDMKYDNNGDADRSSYIVEVRDGKQYVTAVVPPAVPF
jgi:branched-chain amino acid transport system substrate-binding protein